MYLAKGLKLTKRDMKVPGLVEEFRLLTTRQIQSLLYPTLQKAQTRLKKIYDSGLVKRYPYPVLIKEGGKGEYVYHNKKKPKIVFSKLLHTIQLNNIRIAFELACKSSEAIELIAFIPEYRGEITGDGRIRRIVEEDISDPERSDKRTSLIPDAVICLENKINNKKGLFYLELDLGTEKLISERINNNSVLRKMMMYKEYINNGRFKKYNELFEYKFKGFRVLSVMDNVVRIKLLRRELSKRGVHRFIWLAKNYKISKNSVFSRIWMVTDVNDSNKYSIIGE